MTDRPTDDELFDAIGRALAPPPLQPGAAELVAVRMALALPDRASQGRRRTPAWRRPAPALLALTLAVGGIAGGAAAAVGATLPAPLRSAAVAMGLPVDDSELASAKADLRRLQDALGRRDRSAVASAVAQLRHCIATLGAADRAKVDAAADALLARADELLAAAPASGGGAGATGPAVAAPPTAPPRRPQAPLAPVPAPREATLAPRDGRPPDATITTVASGDGRLSSDGDDGRTATTDGHSGSVNATSDGDDGGSSASGGCKGTDGGGGSDGWSGTSNGATGGH